MNTKIISNLQKLIDVNTPIIYINDYDFVRIDELIIQAVGKKNVYEWNPAIGGTHFVLKEKQGEKTLEGFLYQQYIPDADKLPECYLLLKEIEDYIDEPKIKSLLLHIAQRKLYDKAFNTTVLIVSTTIKVPQVLEKYVSFLDIDLPNDDEIETLIWKHVEVNNDKEKFDKDDIPKLMPSLRGLSAFEIDRTLDMAMSRNGTLRADDKELILDQKKQMIKQSGALELIDTNEIQLTDIGGMDELKKYLEAKATVMEKISVVKEYGVQIPKGVFIVGMPGCGKSLCAKASAAAFKAPLLKMDMGSMMGKYVGESEGNLRKAIKLAEAAAPCVLWIDEIEKAFSGVGSQSNDIVTRMFGYLLGWLQDKKTPVYVIATANNADNLPPELKRKGRFDEIFCVNLPTEMERESIFKVHLKKKEKAGKVKVDVNYSDLSQSTDGFNGADIEAVINEAVERKFLKLVEDGKLDSQLTITTDMLIEEANKTVSISKSCKDQIEQMKKVFLTSNFKNASK